MPSLSRLVAASSAVSLAAALPQSLSSTAFAAYTLPQNAANRQARASAIAQKNATFLYGPGTGGGPWSPVGSLGQEYNNRDGNITSASLDPEELLVAIDQNLTEIDTARYHNLATVEDYTTLYSDGNWATIMAPTGVAPGILTNYTSDLLFSMQRLSFSPYLLRRLDPSKDRLPFVVENDIVSTLTQSTLQQLLATGRLFYADYTYLKDYERNGQPMYGANSDALFYISPTSGDFLPLAIRTNANNHSLVYTPLDTAEDWLLAKVMFNVDDFIVESFHHLANTHYVTEIVYEAAIKTMSDEHPIMPLLARAMYGAFGVRPLALATLFDPGQAVESYTPYTGPAIENLTNYFYFTAGGGEYAPNYFRENLKRRGLIAPAVGPELKHFPFYEDAAPIHEAQRNFTHAFVYSYYTSDQALAQDSELQAWLAEANGGAQVIAFPDAKSLQTREDLVDLLTHFFHLCTTAHHSINLNQVLTAATILPLNPTALYKPVPTAKGVTDVAAYLPPFDQCLGVIELGGAFARPLLAFGDRAMVHLFDDWEVLPRMNDATRNANQAFMQAMLKRSQIVAGRKFDAHGLSQGMPFVWQALDPLTMLYSTTI